MPEPVRVLIELYGDHILQGCVKDLTEKDGRPYAVVDVDGVSAPIVIGVDDLLGVL